MRERSSITYIAHARAWLLGDGTFSYAFAIDPQGFHLKHLYWGSPIDAQDVAQLAAETRDWWLNTPDTRAMRQPGAVWRGFESAPRAFTEEFVAQGGFRFDEPAIVIHSPDSTGLLLHYVDHSIVESRDDVTLSIALRDDVVGACLELHYCLSHLAPGLSRWSSLSNQSENPLNVRRLASASWALPIGPQYQVRNFFGHVQGEFQLEDSPVNRGLRTLGTRTGTSGHRGTPWLAFHTEATETAGEAWSVALAYSGSWEISTQLSDDGGVHIVAGVADEEMQHLLEPGQTVITPRSVAMYSHDGFNRLSQRWHDHVNLALPSRLRPLPVMYNSWFALQFRLDETALLEQARLAARLGVELFVLDDGWFEARNDDFHGLGRWVPDTAAFPHGLRDFRDSIQQLGMELGLWLEPEMCTPDSQVYLEHPDWIHGTKNRFWQTHRNQFVLDFGLDAVQDWVVQSVSHAVQESGCTYVVWDMNRPLPLGGPVTGSMARQRHADGLSRVLGELRKRHSEVTWQACSGGGGRADLGILSSMSLTWPSDNTDARDRGRIIQAASQILPPSTLVHWVTDLPERNPTSDRLQQTRSPVTRFHTAMNGALGISADLRLWTKAELQEAADLIEWYKSARELIADGIVHRLDGPENSLALMYVARDGSEAIAIIVAPLFSFGETNVRVRLRGLTGDAQYSLDGREPVSGRLLMQEGLVLDGSTTTSWAMSLKKVQKQ